MLLGVKTLCLALAALTISISAPATAIYDPSTTFAAAQRLSAETQYVHQQVMMMQRPHVERLTNILAMEANQLASQIAMPPMQLCMHLASVRAAFTKLEMAMPRHPWVARVIGGQLQLIAQSIQQLSWSLGGC
jgi:hypothetical protein